VLRDVLAAVGMSLSETPSGAVRSLRMRRLQLRLRGLRFDDRGARRIPPGDVVRLDVCWALAVGLAGVDVVRGAEFMTRYLHLALNSGDAYHVARGFSLEAMRLACEKGPGALHARELRDKAAELAQRINHPHVHGMVAMANGYIAYADGEWETCTRSFERAIGILREQCSGTAWEISFSEVFALTGLWFRGELTDLGHWARAWAAEAHERGDLYAVTSFRTRFTPKVLLAADMPDAALRETREAIEQWGQTGWHVQHCFAKIAEAEIELYRGDAKAAWRYATETWDALESSLLVRAAPMANIGRHVRALAALASVDEGGEEMLRVAEEDALQFERQEAPVSRAWALLLRAGVTAARGSARASCALFADAERELDARGMSIFAAAARRRRGELLGGDAGRALVAEADARMMARGVARPDRMMRVLVPSMH
jgi:hypothetical protein